MTSDTNTVRAPFQRNSLQVKVGAPRGLTVDTAARMQREARMQDWTVGQLLEEMWAAYERAMLAKVTSPPAANGQAKKR